MLLTGYTGWSQCTNTSSFGSVTILPGGAQSTISTCNFAGEFATISGAVAGQTLRFTSSVTTDIITIRSGTSNGPVVAFGNTPLVFANTFTGTLFAHWNTPGCGGESLCRLTTVQCTSCGIATADLSITKTDFRTTYTPGSNGHVYVVEATNNGPDAVTGALITDIFPPEITSASWTVTYPVGGSGPTSGTGNINAAVNLPNGARARFLINVHISPTATGNLINTATVEPPSGTIDPNPANNLATDIDSPVTADLSITKTDGTTTYTPGGTTTYTIVAANNGPDEVLEKSVTDILPAEITSATWTVAYSGGASGPVSGTGNINAQIDFPAGSAATFTLIATISPTATGNLVNTATIPIGGFVDPNPANNSATDTNVPVGCTNSTSFGTATINTSGTIVTISTCSFAGEYSTINGAVNGQTLTFTNSVPTDIITIRSGTPAGPIIASGTSPLTFANTFTGTIYAHWNTPGCGSQTTCRTTTVQCTNCISCTITCPSDITVANDANQCGAIVTYPAPATSGSCGTITSTPASGSFFPIGTTTVTVTSTAGPTCTFTVTVNDTEAPVITCPPPVTVSCASAVPLPDIASVPITDNCPGAVVTHVGDGIGAQTCANRFTIQRTYRVTDAAGNFRECTQTITVNDQTPPTLTCPAPITVSCAAAVPAANIALVTGVSDNCSGVVTVTHVGDVISNQTCANKFTITRTYRATDVCGNFAECTQIITVNDVTAPVITCPANITVSTPIGSCTAVVNFTPTATDNCAGAITIVSVPASGSVFPLGTTTVTSTATDVCGNSSSCTFTITVLDGQLPVISSQPVNRTVCATTPAVFNVVSTNAVSYQWEQWTGSAWAAIPGATSATLALQNTTVSMNTNTYRVKVIGLCTTVTSGAASLFVNPLPTISLSASRNTALLPGQLLTISATVSPGGGSFVWFKNGVPVTGISSGSLSNLTVDNIGTYRAVYTDLNGCVATSADLIISGQASEKLWVYPNPNQGRFEVRYYNQVNENLTLNIYNPLGQKIYQRAFTTNLAYTKLPVDFGNRFTEGVYIVEVINALGKKVGTKRIIVRQP